MSNRIDRMAVGFKRLGRFNLTVVGFALVVMSVSVLWLEIPRAAAYGIGIPMTLLAFGMLWNYAGETEDVRED